MANHNFTFAHAMMMVATLCAMYCMITVGFFQYMFGDDIRAMHAASLRNHVLIQALQQQQVVIMRDVLVVQAVVDTLMPALDNISSSITDIDIALSRALYDAKS